MFELRALKLFTAVPSVVATSSPRTTARSIRGSNHWCVLSQSPFLFLRRPERRVHSIFLPDTNTQLPTDMGACHSSRTTVMAKRCGRKSPLAAFRIFHPRATEARRTVSTINVTYDSVNDPACCEWHLSPLPCHFERVPVRVTIGTRAFGGMPRRAATVRQLQDPRTGNLVAMSLRPGPLPSPRHGVRTCNSPFSFIRLGWTSRQCTKPRLSGLPPVVASISEPQSIGYAFDDGIDGPNYKHITFSRARCRKE